MVDIASELDERLVTASLKYNPENGQITWLVNRGSRATNGKIAGYLRSDGYRIIKLNGSNLYAHRLAWWFTYGEQPPLIDHINRNASDNRIVNLRKADKALNFRNSKLSKRNTSGFKGVSWSRGMKKWRMAFTSFDVSVIEYFENLEEAGACYKKLEQQHA